MIGPVVLATHLVDLIMTVCLIATDKMLHRRPSAQIRKSALGDPLLAKGLNEPSLESNPSYLEGEVHTGLVAYFKS